MEMVVLILVKLKMVSLVTIHCCHLFVKVSVEIQDEFLVKHAMMGQL